MTYQEYKDDFLESLRNDSAINGSDTEDEFITRTLDLLVDFDEINDPLRSGMGDKKGRGNRLMRFDGYSFDETDHSLILFISDFQDTISTDKLTKSRVDELYWRLYYFIDEVCNGDISKYFDESDDIIKIARLIKNRVNAKNDDIGQVLKIRFLILTNKELDTKLLQTNLLETTIRKSKGKTKKVSTNKKIKSSDFNGKPLEINLWHLERIYQLEQANDNEPIIIDIQEDYQELGAKGIPCIKGNIGEDLGYDAYIAIIPGRVLAQIYVDYGSKILEGNIRAFLGTNGAKSVNAGIKRTINQEPTNFFTYNNGIAATASSIETEIVDGELLIKKIVDLQIINGGQTTASLSDAVLKKHNAQNPELEGIYVPMKLTVIEDRESEDEEGSKLYDKMIQLIAKYANSQNKVTAADLFSNDPFHIWMERISKKLLAPPVLSPIPTGWYYERSRKRYQQEQFKLKGDEIKRFGLKFPKKQIINKEQLGMYLTAINMQPYIVSKGKNWVMKAFGAEVGKQFKVDKKSFNEFYFKKCICSAIIFRSIDFYLESNKDSAKRPTGFWYKTGGYKMNIVPYSIAKILSCIPKGYSLNWDMIWKQQSVSPAFLREIEKITKITNDFICDSHGVIVTEYCKQASTWENYRDKVKYELSSEFIDELVPLSLMKEEEESAKKEQKVDDVLKQINGIISLGVNYWENILDLGIKNSIISYQEQTGISQVIKMAETGNIPSTSSGKVSKKAMDFITLALEARNKLESEGILIINESKI